MTQGLHIVRLSAPQVSTVCTDNASCSTCNIPRLYFGRPHTTLCREGQVSATYATLYNDAELIEDYCLGLPSVPHPELIDALSLLGLNLLEYEHFGLLNGYYYRYGIAPEYSASPHALSITLPIISNSEVYKSETSLSSRENKVLSYLRNNLTCTRATLEKELSIPQPSVTRVLNKLILRGYIEKIGSRSTKYSAKQF